MDVIKYLQHFRQTNRKTMCVSQNRTRVLEISHWEAFVHLPVLPCNQSTNDTGWYHRCSSSPPQHSQTQLIHQSVYWEATKLIRYDRPVISLPETVPEGDQTTNYALCLSELGSTKGHRTTTEGKGQYRTASSGTQGRISEVMMMIIIRYGQLQYYLMNMHWFIIESLSWGAVLFVTTDFEFFYPIFESGLYFNAIFFT